jgi:hypothetical protein
VELCRAPNVEIAVIPQGVEVSASPLNSFVVYDERLVTVEIFSGSIAFRDPRDVAHHLELFEYFLSHALRGDDAVAFLLEVADEFMRARD